MYKRCDSNSGGELPNPGECKQKSIFEGPAWCGLIRNRSGPWSECLQVKFLLRFHSRRNFNYLRT